MSEDHLRFRPLNVVAAPGSPAGERNRRWLDGVDAAALFEQIAPGFRPDATLDLVNFGGRTIKDLTFTNLYVGGEAAWRAEDRKHIDDALAAALADVQLNGVVAQYYDGPISSTFRGSQVLAGAASTDVFKNTVETLVTDAHRGGLLTGNLAGTVSCLLLPPGVVLHDDAAAVGGAQDGRDAASSLQGLGGYHGSVHVGADTLYYAVGVYSEILADGRRNGIVAFDAPWKNVVATFYHELNEVRTDPDVEDAIRAGNAPDANRFLGWYSPKGGEIGDIPILEAGTNLHSVMKEVPLEGGGGTVPVQLMYSNRDHGPAER
jgi:hypothetical protein